MTDFGAGSPNEPNKDLDMTHPDFVRNTVPPADPIIGYTVKELIARMEGKLDAYASHQQAVQSTLNEIVPLVRESAKKIEKLELIQLGREAVKTWHATAWKAVYAGIGALSALAITFSILRPF